MGDLIDMPQEPAGNDVEPLWRESVGAELRTERKRQRRTLADVAERAGMSVQYLSEVERGLKEPSSELLAAAAGSLGLRLADLTHRVTRRLVLDLGSAPGPAAAPVRYTGPTAGTPLALAA